MEYLAPRTLCVLMQNHRHDSPTGILGEQRAGQLAYLAPHSSYCPSDLYKFVVLSRSTAIFSSSAESVLVLLLNTSSMYTWCSCCRLLDMSSNLPAAGTLRPFQSTAVRAAYVFPTTTPPSPARAITAILRDIDSHVWVRAAGVTIPYRYIHHHRYTILVEYDQSK